MIKILINGCNGKMGQILCQIIKQREDMIVVGGMDKNKKNINDFKVYADISEITNKPDVIIDFSVPNATFKILEYAKKYNIPIVIATTGFNEKEEDKIKEYSKNIAIFKSANMSFDVIMIKNLLKQIAPMLKNTDIEITEIHHNRKVDSPSGTALMFADVINESLNNEYHYEYNRHDKHEKRDKKEIGISSIRGGNIVGEHIIQFFGEYETFEIKHTSYSRNVFAEGAIRAAEFLVNKKNGLYNMDNLIK